MIRAEALHKQYGSIKALDGVGLTVDRGRTLALFGPNGAGKTTLIRVLSLLARPSSGSIEINGLAAGRDDDAIRAGIGVLSHTSFLYEQLTARENLLFYGKMYGVRDARQRADALLERVSLADRADGLVRGFSRGMRQRVAIARCLMHQPAVVLLDEPYTGLDRHASQALTEMLQQLRGENRTILITTHHISEAFALADELAVMVKGRMVLHRPCAGTDPRDFAQLYLRCVEAGQ